MLFPYTKKRIYWSYYRLPPPTNFPPSLQKPPQHWNSCSSHSSRWPHWILWSNVPNSQLLQKLYESSTRHMEQDLQVKYFDSLYRHQWSMTNSIKTLHNQAQKLLEEANQLQEKKHSLWWEIDYHLHTIMQPKLHQRLYNPYKVYPRPTLPIIQQAQPTPSSSWPVLWFNPNPKKQTQLCCFQCNSLTHIKWNCPQYCCRYCNDMAPGHSQQNCPKNGFEAYNDGLLGHYDIGGEEDGNLNREC